MEVAANTGFTTYFTFFQTNGKGSGAGHGAKGGSPTSSTESGAEYDNTRLPVEPGSGGGNSLNGFGGAGGGYLTLSLYTSLVLNGKCL